MSISANHPIQKLLFFVAQDFDNSLVRVIENFVREIGLLRNWVLGPPEFVNETVNGIDTLGGVLRIYSALPPSELPCDIDRTHLDEVKEVVRSVQIISLKHGLAFEFELAGIHVGSIEDGELDRSLQVGLLEEWEHALRLRK